LQTLKNSGRYWDTSIYQYLRFLKILVIPVLQILEDSGKYWLYQYCRYWKIRYEVAECTCILFLNLRSDLQYGVEDLSVAGCRGMHATGPNG
jgi:hypothetical protein